ncbi:MAG TPA: DUF1385 domain-containing protein [bacterium]|nr:DUF1385 domain-containing protein [bacterium]
MPSVAIGGQAVLEGVMMRSPRYVSVAVRDPSGDLLAVTRPSDSLLQRYPWLGAPVLRGIAALYDAVMLGADAIVLSANAAAEGTPRRPMTGREAAVTLAGGLGVAVVLFFVIPTLAARLAVAVLASPLALSLGEGGLRIALVVGYIAAIGRIPDLARVYQYHGAEHKAVNTFEQGLPLETGWVRTRSRFHPRCGTSFVLIVLLVSLIVFAMLGRPPLWIGVVERLLLLPVVAGVSYEILRLTGRAAFAGSAAAPGIWLQRLTTREPDDAQIEVAIRALRGVVAAEARAGAPML